VVSVIRIIIIRLVIIRLEVERSYRKYIYVEKKRKKNVVRRWPGGLVGIKPKTPLEGGLYRNYGIHPHHI
jgi:hypothetical protein